MQSPSDLIPLFGRSINARILVAGTGGSGNMSLQYIGIFWIIYYEQQEYRRSPPSIYSLKCISNCKILALTDKLNERGLIKKTKNEATGRGRKSFEFKAIVPAEEVEKFLAPFLGLELCFVTKKLVKIYE